MADVPTLQCGGIATYHLLHVTSPKTGAPGSAPEALAPDGAVPVDVTQQPQFTDSLLQASRGTVFSEPGASSSSNNALVPLNESVEEFLTPKKAQMRPNISQLRHDMQWTLHAVQTFVRENELHTNEKAGAVLRAQQNHFQNIAQKWEQ